MEPTSATSARQGRRLLAIVLAVLSLLAAAATFGSATGSAAPPDPAASRSPGPGASGLLPTPTPTPTPTPSCDPTTDPFACGSPTPSPTPTVVVVSPVPDSPSPAPTTPSYLQGAETSPSPHIGETVSSPVPLGGGFVDQLPTPTSAPVAPGGSLAPHQSGLPLPFLAVGAVLILGAIGSLIYAVAPRDKNVFAARPAAPTSPVAFTPYGPDAPTSSILKPPGPASGRRP
ncbi:MAG: hypothetical protein ABR573_08465 [Candidatus Dormibacteria bacterium]